MQELRRFLLKHTILVLTILFCVGISIALVNISHLSTKLIESQALQNAEASADALKQARTFYSANVVSRAKKVHGITITHDYSKEPGAIPLPATYLIELGKVIGENHNHFSVRLFSNYPFPWRKQEGGAKDDFEREALSILLKNPEQKFFKVENWQGRPFLRYAEADVLEPSCVNCHNTYPGTPKTDWKVGDVRGILEINEPLEVFVEQTRAGLRETFVTLGGLSLLGIIGLTIVITTLRQTSQELERRVRERTAQLSEEQEKSENLLLNILPESIATRLKDGDQNIADGFAEVTILFADIVGFTELSQTIPPQELVNLLNEIFSTFDNLSEKYGLEKIKTIGDAYMVASGLPNLRSDHAHAIADMALEMQKEIALFNIRRNISVSIRIGINTGSVVAGVIGKKKFIYDLWGDAVNTASRMESHGIPGAIQVTPSTYELLKNAYFFEERGIIEIKGKGMMTTYLLINPRL